MKTLLILSEHPEFPESIRAGLNLENYRIVYCSNLEEAEPLLHRGLLNACILDLESVDVRGMWIIEKLRRQLPQCPIMVYTGAAQWDWEEEAYLKGVSHVFTKPVRPKLLNAMLERIFAKAVPASIPVTLTPVPQQLPVRQNELARSNSNSAQPSQALEVLRHFSAILTHSLDSEAMLKKFLLLLRETVGVNRAAIFLREQTAMFGERATGAEENRCLRKACAMGLPSGLLEHFELSFQAGIGGHLFRSGRILRRNSDEVRMDMAMQQEFELLGAQVAIPILDRETLIGVAVFDGRVTGEPLMNSELELIFHLLEELALAVKNIWLHDQLTSNHEMMADIFRQLSSACVVVGQDLTIIHANKAARNVFSKARRGADLEFSDLPQALGGKIYQVLRSGTALAAFKYQPEDSPNAIFNVSVVPFQKQGSVLPASALLMAEDLTQSEQLRKLEIEAANLRLVTTMADRLAHEVGNALVPLSTHQQLLKERYKDPEFRATLEVAMTDSIKRISRLTSQMRFLARDSAVSVEAFPMERLIEDAFEEAQKHQPAKASKLEYKNGARPIIVTGDRTALKHALSEVMLNALQANPTDPKIGVQILADAGGNGVHDVQIEIQDNGTGFKPDSAQKIPTPFFTTRNVGLGLGLTVSRKIIERHNGKLEIVTAKPGISGTVRITLPLVPAEGIHN